MRVIKSYSIGSLHELAVDHIVQRHRTVITEDGESTFETEPICLVTDTPFDQYRISSRSPFKEPYMKEYTKAILEGTSSSFVYDYHTRLYDYKIQQNGFDVSINQIEYIIKKLSENKTTRRAQGITWNPATDCFQNDVPCLQYIQCHVVCDKLNMTVMFRSNDMLLAFGANAYALTYVQKKIAEALHMPIGTYTHIALIPHIYNIRDADVLSKFKHSAQ